MPFYGFNISVELRSVHDPQLVFRELTHGSGSLDDEPNSEFFAAVVLMICGGLLFLGSMYKTYRHCKKHAFRRWQQQRRASKYEADENKKLVQKEEQSP